MKKLIRSKIFLSFFFFEGGSKKGLKRLTVTEEFSKKQLNNLHLVFISLFLFEFIYLFYFRVLSFLIF